MLDVIFPNAFRKALFEGGFCLLIRAFCMIWRKAVYFCPCILGVAAKYYPLSWTYPYSHRYLILFLKFMLLLFFGVVCFVGFFFSVLFYFVFVTDVTSEHLSSSRCISHLYLRIVFTKPERNGSYTQLDFSSFLGLVLSLNNWQISPMGTAKGNLHVQNTELKHSKSSWTHPSTY